MSELLEQLVEMSRALADPACDYVILGEGNTSVRADAGSFWVKASGTQLATADSASFVRVRSAPILDALDGPELDDDQVKRLLTDATVEGDRSPSIETFLHALCLQQEGIRFVGHTHPTAALGLLCSRHSRQLWSGSMFPDQIVLLGPAYVYVPYTDPGLPLALAVRRSIDEFVEAQGRVPRVILMENHGVIALGSSSQQVLNVTRMLVKTCRILADTLVAGGPRWLTDENVERIDKRPDELARRRDLS
jgi:rhamnose utilization protein RhaD (predicted bifunctional aldolase and dehydrogenase)